MFDPGEAFAAANIGDVDALRRMLNAHDDLVRKRNAAGETLLLVACRQGQTSCVDVLMKTPRVEIDATDSNGNTVLHLAICCGSLAAMILRCLDGFSDRNKLSQVTQYLNNRVHPEAGPVLHSSGGGVTVLHMVACMDDETLAEECIKHLLRFGADIEQGSASGGYTPLMMAANSKHAVTLQSLLNHGANIRATALDGTTVLSAAANGGSSSMVTRVLSQNAPLDPRAFEPAVRQTNFPVVFALLEGRVPIQPGVASYAYNNVMCEIVSTDVNACSQCGKRNGVNIVLQRCSGCTVKYYCSQNCQMEHWRAGHHRECESFKAARLGAN